MDRKDRILQHNKNYVISNSLFIIDFPPCIVKQNLVFVRMKNIPAKCYSYFIGIYRLILYSEGD